MAVPAAPGPRRRVLADGVYEHLTALLVDGDLAAGSPLRVDALAREWAVSPTPVREALARAEGAGLVVRQPLRGWLVAPVLPAEEFRQLMEARLLIEAHGAQRAAERADEAALAELDEHLEVMRRSPKGPHYRDFRDYLRADVAFHTTIARAGGNRFLAAALEPLGAHLQRFRRFAEDGVTDAEQSLAEHAAVLAALRRRDPAGAAAAMEAHLRGITERATA